MSMLETNPLANSTTVTHTQNQVINVIPDQILVDADSIDPVNRPVLPLLTQQITMPGVASMYKYLSKFSWTIGSTSNTVIWSYPISFENMIPLAKFGVDQTSVYNYSEVEINLSTTFNPTFQGSLLFYFDPSPNSFIANKMVPVNTSLNQIFQFPYKFLIEPKNRQGYTMMIPLHFPFDLVQARTPNYNYLSSYQLGTVRAVVNVPLSTKSTITSQDVRVSARLLGYKAVGNRF